MAKNVGLPSDPALLSALLEGLQMSRQRLDAQIASVRAALAGEPEPVASEPSAPEGDAPPAPVKGRKGRKPGSVNKPKKGRRKLSPAARKAIAAAQKRRWEEFRKKNPA